MIRSVFIGVIAGLLASLTLVTVSVNEGWPHVHWINKGKYLDATTGMHCCNEDDCKVASDEAISTYHRLPDGGALFEGIWFKPGQIHFSEDGLWYRCVKRCLFIPSGT